MNTGIIILIVFLVLLVAAGITVGLVLYFRNRNKTPTSSGGNNNNNNNNNNTNGQTGGFTGPTIGGCPYGATGASGTPQGVFSLIPARLQTAAMTVKSGTNTVTFSGDPSSNYGWFFGSVQLESGNTANNVLIYNGTLPGSNTCNNGILNVYQDGTNSPAQILTFREITAGAPPLTWNYTPPTPGNNLSATICPNERPGYCMYYDSVQTNSVTLRQFSSNMSGDTSNFRWILSTPTNPFG